MSFLSDASKLWLTNTFARINAFALKEPQDTVLFWLQQMDMVVSSGISKFYMSWLKAGTPIAWLFASPYSLPDASPHPQGKIAGCSSLIGECNNSTLQ